jgi:hypothetical protein
MKNPYAQLANDVTTRTIEAAQEAQLTALGAGFELAGKLLEQQRAYTAGLVDAFAKAAVTQK